MCTCMQDVLVLPSYEAAAAAAGFGRNGTQICCRADQILLDIGTLTSQAHA